MLSCKHVALILTQSLDERLPWYKRVALRTHLLVCTSCRQVRKQLLFIKEAAEHLEGNESHGDPSNNGTRLSQATRESMKERLRGEKD